MGSTMSSQEGRIKIEHLLRQLEHVVEVDWPEAPTHGTVPDDRGRNEKGEKVQGKEPQKNEHAAPEEPLAQLARACSLESAEQASANRRAGDAAIGAEEDSDAEVGSDEDDEDGGEGGADERDFVVDEEDYEGGAAGSGGSASRQGTDADRRSQVAGLHTPSRKFAIVKRPALHEDLSSKLAESQTQRAGFGERKFAPCGVF